MTTSAQRVSCLLISFFMFIISGCDIDGSISVSPEIIEKGQTTTLSWGLSTFSGKADSASIEPGIGDVSLEGSLQISPETTTTYTITWTGSDGTATDTVTVTVVDPPTVSIQADKTSILEGDTVELTWNSENATTCTIEPNIGSVSLNGSVTVAPLQATTYTITATGQFSTSTASITVEVFESPTVTLTADETLIEIGSSATLSWVSTDTIGCTLEPGFGSVDLNGSVTVTPLATTTYILTASGVMNSVTKQITIEVVEPPSVSLTVDKTQISADDTAVLSWNSDNATSCTIEPGIGTVEANGSLSVTPANTTTYTITAQGEFSTATSSVTISVLSEPVLTLAADKQILEFGDSVSLTWISINATTCSLEPGFGFVGLNDSYTVTPSETTTYTLTATNGAGSVSKQLTVEVIEPPFVSISVDQDSIQPGESAILTWRYANATSCIIEPDIGSVAANGTLTIAPGQTTTYTITATGPLSSISKEVTVFVEYLEPVIHFSATPEAIVSNNHSLLSWTTENSVSATIDPDIGAVDLNGSLEVSPSETTQYTLNVTGRDGSVKNSSLTVYVNDLPPALFFTVSESVINYGDSATLSWNVRYTDHVYLNNGIGQVGPVGDLEVSPEYTTTYYLTESSFGITKQAKVSVKVLGNPPAQLSEGSFGWKYQDLVPEDASLESYDEERFIILTGLVNDSGGNPLQGVSVEVFNHPEYGTALTDETGRFSIPAEGGGLLKLIYRKNDYITVHRKKETPWNDVVNMDTVMMLKLDNATELTFDGNPETILTHKSTTIEDPDPEYGTRACTLVFAGDNLPHKIDANGNVVEALSTVNVRATEFISPESMPSILPSSSAFTYCVELSIDGAERIVFEKPVAMFVDNFLEFSIGEFVPLGYYNRDNGKWIAAEDGIVVQLLDTDSDGIVDSLDATGDGAPDDLDNDGSFSDEISGLADTETYKPGMSYWRVNITHFTPWDCNWPYGYPDDADYPNVNDPFLDQLLSEIKPCKNPNTSVVDRSRVLHTEIPIPGTDLTLHYASNRVDAFEPLLTVPVSEDSVPSSCSSFSVQTDVAGTVYTHAVLPSRGYSTSHSISSRNYRSQRSKGSISAKVAVGYKYPLVYRGAASISERLTAFREESSVTNPTFSVPPAFGRAGSRIISARRGRMDFSMWRFSEPRIFVPGTADSIENNGEFAEGWTISKNHRMNPNDTHILYKGDGTICKTDTFQINTVAGIGSDEENNEEDGSNIVFIYSGDGGPALEAPLNKPKGIAVDSSGNLFIADSDNIHLRKVDKNGIITNVAGNIAECHYTVPDYPAECTNFDGEVVGSLMPTPMPAQEGIYATDYELLEINDVVVDSLGNIYLSTDEKILKIDVNGIIYTVADYLSNPRGLSLDSSGNLYFTEPGEHRVGMIDTNGLVTDIAGTGVRAFGGDGGNAIEAQLYYPNDTAVDSYGNIYIADSYNHRIRKIDTRGIITTVAGGGSGETGFTGDGGLATEAKLAYPKAVALDKSGNIYIATSQRIRKVNSKGIISTIAGNGYGFEGDGGFAVNAVFSGPEDIALDAAGNLYITDRGNDRIRKISLIDDPNKKATSDITIYDDEGLIHTMSSTGLHKNTKDIETGKLLLQFSYSGTNLSRITDQFGKQITINWQDGKPVEIISPQGLKTTLTVDENNHLTQATYEDGSFYKFQYTDTGLMEDITDPEENTIHYNYEDSRIISVSDQEGGKWDYVKSAGSDGIIKTDITSAENNVTHYEDRLPEEGSFETVITSPAGNITEYVRSAGGSTVSKSSRPCGMGLVFQYKIDPKFKYKYLSELTETTENDLSQTTVYEKKYDVEDVLTEIITRNGNSTICDHNVSNHTKTVTTAENRVVTSQYDPNTLLTTQISIVGLNDLIYEYCPPDNIHAGKLRSIKSGTREIEYFYYDGGNIYQIKDPENVATVFEEYDTLGRIRQIVNSDGLTRLDYDNNGNITVLTNASSKNHGFGFNGVNLGDTYTTPMSRNYAYEYDSERRLKRVAYPSGKEIIYDYLDSATGSYSRLMHIQTPEGNIDLSYSCGSKVESISKNGETVHWEYNGPFVTSETLSGTLNQSLSYGYENDGDFNLDTFTYAGASDIFAYDGDGLLVGTGEYNIIRNAQNGLPETVTGGSVTKTRAFNGYAEVDGVELAVNGTTLCSLSVTGRNNNGKITGKTETIGGTTDTYTYEYSDSGKLASVTKNGELVEQYRYSENPYGICDYRMNTLRGITGENLNYDDEDRLLGTSDTTYTYNEDGFLASKIRGPEETLYDYSSRGELLSVTLPGGTLVEYVYDPFGRCLAKKIGGNIIEKYLWQGQAKLLAVYDGTDQRVMRFEYAESHLPIAMEKEGVTYYLMFDQAGSLRAIYDIDGNAVKTVSYDSFGVIISDSNTSFGIPLGFAGGLQDRDTGLVRFGHRDYDPETGRWTSKEPTLFAAGDMDLYGYAMGDPVNGNIRSGSWCDGSFSKPDAVEYGFTPSARPQTKAINPGVAAWQEQLNGISKPTQDASPCDNSVNIIGGLLVRNPFDNMKASNPLGMSIDQNYNGLDTGGGSDKGLDLDYDGMPHQWEIDHGLDPLIDDSQDDYDNDGFSNIVEYMLGTEPDDPSVKPSAGNYYQYDSLGRITSIIRIQ